VSAFVEYQVRCFRCGHVHDERVEWLMGHPEVERPAAGCGARTRINIGDLSVLVRSSNGRDEVRDLSRWSPRKLMRAPEAA
jgi:hypothetical protein